MAQFFEDDLTENFRHWQDDKTAADGKPTAAMYAEAAQLTKIMIGRHPDTEPDVIEMRCHEWVGVDFLSE